MTIKHDIKTYSISWLSSSYDKNSATGMIDNYYLPETMDELKTLCIELLNNNELFRVIGHTSNLYFLPETNIKHLISARKLNRWQIKGDLLICECGVNVKTLAKAMIEEGFEGFAGLIDLPGTVGGAIYGNASVGSFSISKLLESVEILNKYGQIEAFSHEDMKFQFRSSVLKRKEMRGTILSCTLRLKKGNKDKERKRADSIHNWRRENQPGPLNNLGTTALLGSRSAYGLLALSIAKLLYFFHFPRNRKRNDFFLSIMGASHLHPYLFGYNRFMWKDSKAHEYFTDYVLFINKAYNNPKLEIEVL
jgi:UDP-N-acetylmuramate dehydrogenase